MKVGIDLVKNQRFATLGHLAPRFLTPAELLLLEDLEEEQKVLFLAGRWALKEAIIKCDNNIMMKDVAVTWDCQGAPVCSDPRFLVSLSNDDDYSVAVAVLVDA